MTTEHGGDVNGSRASFRRINDVYIDLVDRNRTEFQRKHKEVKMLVLTRRKQEHIHKGDSIFLKVLEVQGHKVRLGFDKRPDLPRRSTEHVSGSTGRLCFGRRISD